MNLSLSHENLLFQLSLLIRQRVDVFIDLLNLYIYAFLHSCHHSFFNCLRKLFEYRVQILYLLDSGTNLGIHFLMDLLNFSFFLIVNKSKFFFNHLNLICDFFVHLSEAMIETVDLCLIFM